MSDPLPICLDPLPGSTMSDEAILLRLRERLDRVAWPVSLRLNHNRRILISLRGSPRRGMRLSIHAALLGYPAAVEELPGWISANGRPTGPGIRHALADLGRSLREHERT
ncbi:MAG: hypothetical protein H0W83_11465, partial [Planctomycetes bacterium]|nr:hypothetical protein [Planctomycetota bacterium]